MEKIYSITQVARLIKRTPELVRQIVRAGDLLAERDRKGRYLIHKEDVHRLVAERRASPFIKQPK